MLINDKNNLVKSLADVYKKNNPQLMICDLIKLPCLFSIHDQFMTMSVFNNEMQKAHILDSYSAIELIHDKIMKTGKEDEPNYNLRSKLMGQEQRLINSDDFYYVLDDNAPQKLSLSVVRNMFKKIIKHFDPKFEFQPQEPKAVPHKMIKRNPVRVSQLSLF